MQPVSVHSVVRLRMGIPPLGLQCGDVGVVVDVCLQQGGVLFDIEFVYPYRSPVRTLLLSAQVEILDPQTRDAA